MNAYSKDLRLKVFDAVERGVLRREVSKLLGHLAFDHLALSQAEGFRPRDRPEALYGAQGEDSCQPRPQAGALAPARRERHRYFGGAPRDVREGAGDLRLRGDDESCGAQAKVDFLEKDRWHPPRETSEKGAHSGPT
jgi:hypothetical protein